MVSNLIPLIIAFLIPFIVYPTITSFPVLYGVILITTHTAVIFSLPFIERITIARNFCCIKSIASLFAFFTNLAFLNHYKLCIKPENHQKSVCLNQKLLNHPCGRLYDPLLFECFQSCHAHRTSHNIVAYSDF